MSVPQKPGTGFDKERLRFLKDIDKARQARRIQKATRPRMNETQIRNLAKAIELMLRANR